MPFDPRRLLIALDFPDAASARALMSQLDPATCRVKVGKELFVAAGPALVRELSGAGFEVFLDLKFHDIPNTVAGACRAASELGAWMLSVHVAGGRSMLEAAIEAVRAFERPPVLIGITVLTSMDRVALAELGMSGGPEIWVRRWTTLAADAGLDGVVCSPMEAAMLRASHGRGLTLVVPGVRPSGSNAGDQKRIATPAEALAAGADYLVIGRPVIRSPDPAGAIRAILSEISDFEDHGVPLG